MHVGKQLIWDKLIDDKFPFCTLKLFVKKFGYYNFGTNEMKCEKGTMVLEQTNKENWLKNWITFIPMSTPSLNRESPKKLF